jgi:hypothetical protein
MGERSWVIGYRNLAVKPESMEAGRLPAGLSCFHFPSFSTGNEKIFSFLRTPCPVK